MSGEKKKRESESEYEVGAMQEKIRERESDGLREKTRMKEVIQKNEKERKNNRGKRAYENGNGRRRKNGKKKNTGNMILEERECREDKRIKRKKKCGREDAKEVERGRKKRLREIEKKTTITTKIFLNNYF